MRCLKRGAPVIFYEKSQKFIEKSEKSSIMQKGTPMDFSQKSPKFHEKKKRKIVDYANGCPYGFSPKIIKFHEKKAKNYRLCKGVTLCFRRRMWLRSYDFPDFESNFCFPVIRSLLRILIFMQIQ